MAETLEGKLSDQRSYKEDGIDLHELIGVLLDERNAIISATIALLVLGIFYVLTAAPVYSVDAVVQVESKQSALAAVEELTGLGGGDAPSQTEIELIRSRLVISAVVDQLNLDIIAEPVYLPIVGRALARKNQFQLPDASNIGLQRFSWGGQSILVQRFEVPSKYVEMELNLVATSFDEYDLLTPDGSVVLHGRVGELATKTTPAGEFSLFVVQMKALSGNHFSLTKRLKEKVIADLQQRLTVTEKGKQTGIIELGLEGSNPERIQSILNQLVTTYVRQNVERTSEQARKTLEFLEQQLPAIQGTLMSAEAQLNAYQSKIGSVNLPIETQNVIEKITELERQISSVDLERAEAERRFTTSHPTVVTLAEKKATLVTARDQLNLQIRKMPKEIQESARLQRDVKVADGLYILMLDKMQELRMVKAGTIGNVRVIDYAYMPYEPVKPRTKLVIVGSLILGVLVGIVAAFVKKTLFRGVEDPEQLERETGLPVYASIPHSSSQRLGTSEGRSGRWPLLTLVEQNDLAVESIKSLRTSLQFALMGETSNIIVVSGPSPGIGKSFVAANLAVSLAQMGKKTMLVDADMRKGHLHRYFGTNREKGLSRIISGELTIPECVVQGELDELSFLPAGVVPPNPAELLMSPMFDHLLEEVSRSYDFVIIDTPPVLAVTDAAIIGRRAALTFMVVRSGRHPMREIVQTIKTMVQNGVSIKGFVMNDVPQRAGRYGYYRYGGYHYQYTYK